MSRRLNPAGGSRLECIIRDRYRSGDIGAGTHSACSTNCSSKQGPPRFAPSTASSPSSLAMAPSSPSPSSTASHEPAPRRWLAPDIYTYNILIGSCCYVGPLDLGFATFGHMLRTGWKTDTFTFSQLLKGLCAEKRVGYTMDVLICSMPKLGCTPDVVSSYSTVLKGLCDEMRREEALELIRMMADDGGSCPTDVVSYSTVIDGFFKEGDVDRAYILFKDMLDRGGVAKCCDLHLSH